MQFLNPLALIGLLSIPAIIAMYLLKQKYKELTLPSLYLWRAASGVSEAQRPWQKLRKNLLMLLQLLLAGLIVLALSRPFLPGTGASSSCVLILDCSMSMGAEDVSPSRFEAAKRAMAAFINAMPAGDVAAIVAMDKNPAVAASFSGEKGRLLAALD
ncbi:MAG: BatA and WFA domain-containing protein, partial [Clostridiales bacterium]|nr:BatA and WFA domain-containing protein [Clostridiales bacterium]